MTSPNTTFSAGAVLTAAQMNNLPFGSVGRFSSTTAVNTNSTSYVDEGATVTFNAINNRVYLVLFHTHIYPQSGSPVPTYKIMQGANTISEYEVGGFELNAARSIFKTFMCYFTATATGSLTVKVQYKTSTGTVQDYAAATQPRLLIVTDVGLA